MSDQIRTEQDIINDAVNQFMERKKIDERVEEIKSQIKELQRELSELGDQWMFQSKWETDLKAKVYAEIERLEGAKNQHDTNA